MGWCRVRACAMLRCWCGLETSTTALTPPTKMPSTASAAMTSSTYLKGYVTCSFSDVTSPFSCTCADPDHNASPSSGLLPCMYIHSFHILTLKCAASSCNMQLSQLPALSHCKCVVKSRLPSSLDFAFVMVRAWLAPRVLLLRLKSIGKLGPFQAVPLLTGCA